MTFHPSFCALSARRIAGIIAGATRRVVYAAPGMQLPVAQALADLMNELMPPELTVSLDVDEETLRLGYGSMEAVDLLNKAEIEIKNSPGFRSGILIVDTRGWIFTPVPLYLEDEPQSDETPNAIELSEEQVDAFALRFCPETKKQAIANEPDPVVAAEIAAMPAEFGVQTVSNTHLEVVRKAMKDAPPARFDVVRQVRVFEPYLQYVELHLTGAAVQKKRVQIPPEIQHIGASQDLEGRLKTTFDLLKKSSALSSKKLEDELNEIRKNLTRSLGTSHGRVVLKNAKPVLEKRIEEFRANLEAHKKLIEKELQAHIDESRDAVVDFFLPAALENPPDAIIGDTMSAKPDEDDVRKWLTRILNRVFPRAKDLTGKMELVAIFKNVTFESLNQKEFLQQIKSQYPGINWDKAYNEFRAAGEKRRSQS